ncbi:hypothetical protein PICSAR235_00817 [Mycobacterium avium subsp. paratuberculosis]|nr:hypothetical protein PICSAR10_00285 [Mycobacterium avium subsp. paratuberculosis]CAG7145183.1 hypothetical protein PICSAR235_00817 [Mycobacterium avium subsp. paratuberculosis]CAG7214420.1 hypothetical protein PICSAR26_00461 [Mycobacterium avium subsp. paratuberculosis]CAG7246188.1 hypothetical protein PICSAR55_00816 [Mycobacterium avium subsp. paratuberculosis]CAG7352456.1 hypothetical protein PICSAR81_01264 [Mycobacterium avium subsp. paratuberculosis]
MSEPLGSLPKPEIGRVYSDSGRPASCEARAANCIRSSPASTATLSRATCSSLRNPLTLDSAPPLRAASTSETRNACWRRVRSKSVKEPSFSSRRCLTKAIASAASMRCTPWWKSAPE